MPASLHALSVAGLLCLPLALLLRTPLEGRLASVGRIGERTAEWLTHWYPWLVVGVTSWLAFGVARSGLRFHHNVETAALLVLVMGCVRAAPIWPLLGPLAYALLSYTFGRDDTVTVALMRLGAQSWIAALSVAAIVLWARRQPQPVPFARGLLVWTAALFGAWMAASVLASTVAGRPLDPDLIWRSTRNVEALSIFLVAAHARPTLLDLRIMVLAVSVALILRQVFLTSLWLLEQNLAMVTVVTVPVAVVLAACRPFNRTQVALAAAAAYLAGMILFVRNRGAVVGLAAACFGLWPLARRRWLGLFVLSTVPVAGAYWAWDAGLLNRFTEIYSDGRFRGTSLERLNVWTNGLELARQTWLFGVGPGNFEHAIAHHTGGRVTLNAHNSYVELLVEAGAPALALYLVVFVAALVTLSSVARRFRDNWRRTVAAGLLGSFAAHLAAGTFLSNPSLVWTWTLLGVAASLAQPVPGSQLPVPGSRVPGSREA